MLKKVLLLVALIALALPVAAQATKDKVYVCHAAGHEGTTKFVTLYVPANESGFPNGHFTEGGTTAAGHEDDYLGKCIENTTPSPTPEITPSPTPEVTPVPTPEITPEPTTEVTSDPTPTLPPTDMELASANSSGFLFILGGLTALLAGVYTFRKSRKV